MTEFGFHLDPAILARVKNCSIGGVLAPMVCAERPQTANGTAKERAHGCPATVAKVERTLVASTSNWQKIWKPFLASAKLSRTNGAEQSVRAYARKVGGGSKRQLYWHLSNFSRATNEAQRGPDFQRPNGGPLVFNAGVWESNVALFVLLIVGVVVAQTWLDWRDTAKKWVLPDWAQGLRPSSSGRSNAHRQLASFASLVDTTRAPTWEQAHSG